MIVVVKCNNGLVTNKYLDIISCALGQAKNEKIEFIDNISKTKQYNKKTDYFVVARTVDAFKLCVRKYKHVFMWFQGVEPEESYLNHHNRLRYFILSRMEKFILNKSEFCFFVSKSMANHYKEKYNYKKNNYYCMPCMNTSIHRDAFLSKEKYANNKFAYVGSLAKWQKFDETVLFYKKIEDLNLPNSELLVFTSEKEKAESIIMASNIKKYHIDFVDNDKLGEALSDVKYGLILRDDNIVNRVSTPTKISSYISCGLIPIYNNCIEDFSNIAKKMKFAICEDDDYEKILLNFANNKINNLDVFDEFNQIFCTYYNEEFHKKNIIKKITEK